MGVYCIHKHTPNTDKRTYCIHCENSEKRKNYRFFLFFTILAKFSATTYNSSFPKTTLFAMWQYVIEWDICTVVNRFFFQALSPKQEDVTERRKPFGRRCSKFTGDRVRYLEESQPHMALQDCLYICISWVTLPVNTMVVCLVEKFVRTVTGSKSYSIGQSDLVLALKRSKYFHRFIHIYRQWSSYLPILAGIGAGSIPHWWIKW